MGFKLIYYFIIWDDDDDGLDLDGVGRRGFNFLMESFNIMF